VDCHFVINRIRVDARESFDQVERVAGGSATTIRARARFAGKKIRCVHDQRIALEMADRIAHIRPDVSRNMRSDVKGNDASLVDHLLKDGHIARPLDDLGSVAVDHRKYGARDAPGDASDVVREVLPGIRSWVVVTRSNPSLSR